MAAEDLRKYWANKRKKGKGTQHDHDRMRGTREVKGKASAEKLDRLAKNKPKHSDEYLMTIEDIQLFGQRILVNMEKNDLKEQIKLKGFEAMGTFLDRKEKLELAKKKFEAEISPEFNPLMGEE